MARERTELLACSASKIRSVVRRDAAFKMALCFEIMKLTYRVQKLYGDFSVCCAVRGTGLCRFSTGQRRGYFMMTGSAGAMMRASWSAATMRFPARDREDVRKGEIHSRPS